VRPAYTQRGDCDIGMVEQAEGHLVQQFKALYDRTYDRVSAFVLRRGFSEHEARDVVAETYMTLWRRIRDVPGDPMLADAWVFGIARRTIANVRRSDNRRRRLAERLFEQHRVDHAFAPDVPDRLLHVLAELPRRDREMLQLAVWDELTHAQIAHVVGCSENAVAVRLHRARKALRRQYDAQIGGRGAS
jgi:RNA polymerase sigma-70 factor (ECF subfamily)